MSGASIVDQLERFEEAVRNDSFEQLDSILEELTAAYDAREAPESIRLRKARQARNADSRSPDERTTLETYQSAQLHANLIRGSLLAAGAMYLTDPTTADEEELLETASELASTEQSLAETASTVDSIASDVETPPSITVASVTKAGEQMRVGESKSIELTVLNTGESQARTVTVTPDSELTVTPEERAIGTLQPEASGTVTFEVEASSEGDMSVSFSVTSDNAGSATRSVPVPVLSRTESYRSVTETLQGLEEKIEANASIADDDREALLDPVDSALDSLEDAVDADDRVEENEAVRTARLRLGAFLNALEDVSGLSAAFRWTMTQNAERAIEALSRTVEPLSIDEAIDRNDSDEIEGQELRRALELWEGDEPVPGTGGKKISDGKMTDLIERYATDRDVPEWFIPVGGAGLSGAAIYGYLRYLDSASDRDDGDRSE